MESGIVECVPNFSEGRDRAKVDRIAQAIAGRDDVTILGQTMDADHHRSVITFAGPPDAVLEAAFRGVAEASRIIDLNSHAGVHPRIGAADVVPFVPVQDIAMADSVAMAEELGLRLWHELGIPVYLYEAAARIPERKRLENVRRGQFEGLRSTPDQTRWPDIGGPEFHPTAGATVVGAREFLIAYNINLNTENLEIAKAIARTIRASSGGLPYVKALGLPLLSRRQTQVSMNITDFKRMPVHVVFEAVREQAELHGVSIAGSEIIGLVPKAVLEMAAAHCLQVENFSPELVLENRLRTLK